MKVIAVADSFGYLNPPRAQREFRIRLCTGYKAIGFLHFTEKFESIRTNSLDTVECCLFLNKLKHQRHICK